MHTRTRTYTNNADERDDRPSKRQEYNMEHNCAGLIFITWFAKIGEIQNAPVEPLPAIVRWPLPWPQCVRKTLDNFNATPYDDTALLYNNYTNNDEHCDEYEATTETMFT